MMITHEREKLIQAINFFVRNTHKCGKTKLYKLLYFLDFEHFKATGRSVTGLTYYAWPMGPVPVSLHNEIDAPEPDLAAAFEFSVRPVKNGTMLVITPKAALSEQNFSPRELALLKQLAREYRDADADGMVEATHLENFGIMAQTPQASGHLAACCAVAGLCLLSLMHEMIQIKAASTKRAPLRRANRFEPVLPLGHIDD